MPITARVLPQSIAMITGLCYNEEAGTAAGFSQYECWQLADRSQRTKKGIQLSGV